METEEIINKALADHGLHPDGNIGSYLHLIARTAIELAQEEWKKQPQNSYAKGYNKGYEDGYNRAIDEQHKTKMLPFDREKAKNGSPVCTRDG